jgi:hypothetical protein
MKRSDARRLRRQKPRRKKQDLQLNVPKLRQHKQESENCNDNSRPLMTPTLRTMKALIKSLPKLPPQPKEVKLAVKNLNGKKYHHHLLPSLPSSHLFHLQQSTLAYLSQVHHPTPKPRTPS